MKWVVLLLFFAGAPVLLFSQINASVYFQRLPFPPQIVCTDDTSINSYFRDLGKVQKELSKDISEREKVVNMYMKDHKQEMKQQMVQNANLHLTPEQMQEMKKDNGHNKHMTQQQKMEMADQMMQQSMNMSMQEVQQLSANSKKKDTAALKRYSQAYSTERMADQNTDPATIEADRLKQKSMADLSKQLYDVNERLTRRGSKYTQLLDSLQVESDTAFSELLKRMQPYEDQIASINEMRQRDENRRNDEDASRQDFEQVKMLQKQIQQIKYQYCFERTPKYFEILKGLQMYLPTTFADCDSVDYLNSELIFRQTGVRPPKEALGISALKAVENYASLLANCRKYKLVSDPNKAEEQTIDQ
jgi:hypothetical protein